MQIELKKVCFDDNDDAEVMERTWLGERTKALMEVLGPVVLAHPIGSMLKQ